MLHLFSAEETMPRRHQGLLRPFSDLIDSLLMLVIVAVLDAINVVHFESQSMQLE